ncbi:FhaA domain-containing protein [Streptomyces sp. Y7]|uniref:FhaA domain-containing protein n=1 Tax=Streptomyces sp. Y7 TaxID=3342392 RepID=UPI0037181F4B
MSTLTGWERALERAEGALWGRFFRREPVDVVAALRRECDSSAVVCSSSRVVVPNAYDVTLAEHVHDELTRSGSHVGQALTDKLAQHGEHQGYEWAGPLAVHVTKAREVPNGRYQVTSRAMPHVSAAGFQSDSR